jgi:hypothetical protein
MCIRAFVAAACCIALLPVGAAGQQVGGGVKGGLSLGDIPRFADELDVSEGTSSLLIGWAVGGFLAIRFEGGFSLQPEVLYAQKGVKLEVRESGAAMNVKYKGDYLDIPVLARYTFGKGVRGYVFAGPSFDFKLNAKMTIDALGQSDDEDLSDEVEPFEFALVFGGGVELGPVLLEARWSEGLTNIAKSDAGESAGDVKTRTYLLLFGVRF